MGLGGQRNYSGMGYQDQEVVDSENMGEHDVQSSLHYRSRRLRGYAIWAGKVQSLALGWCRMLSVMRQHIRIPCRKPEAIFALQDMLQTKNRHSFGLVAQSPS